MIGKSKRKKLTIRDLIEGRGVVQRTNIFAGTADEAAAAQAAGIDIITVDGRVLTPEIRRACSDTFVIGGLAFGHLTTTDDYLRAACALYELGADALYCAASLRTVERLAEERFPIVGHVGLIPWHASWTGGWRAVGKTVDSARDVWRQVRRLEEAGAFGAEIEVVPHRVAAEIAQRSSLFLISMGAGSGCHAQYLFAEDILGLNTWRYPRHSKRYADLRAEEERIQAMRVDAFRAFIDDVESGGYPGDEHLVDIDDAIVDEFVASIDDRAAVTD
jgi:3-methyl-2-oxobutanoate hydroxymethyltransferase